MTKGIVFIDSIRDLRGKRVLLRAGLDTPLEGGKVSDDSRIRRALPTIMYLKKRGAKIIVASHLGRSGETLKPVARALNSFVKCGFIPELTGQRAKRAVGSMRNGSVLMLENLRRYPGEEKNALAFAKKLAALADIYVNDAFLVSHRRHASIVTLPKLLPAYGGLLLSDEIKYLSLAHKPKHPFILVLGGAKFETKIPLIKKMLRRADKVLIGGAVAIQFFREAGLPVGKSFFEKRKFGLRSLSRNKKIILPRDVVLEDGTTTRTALPGSIRPSERIVDIGPSTFALFDEKLSRAKLIVMNGPMGYYEGGFAAYTNAMLKSIARSKAISIVGGGDTNSLIMRLGIAKKFAFVSTGGGAMIEFLNEGTLPGIEALRGRG